MRYHMMLFLWLLTDALLFVASYALAYYLRLGSFVSTDFPFSQYIGIAAVIAPLWLLALATTRTFALTRRQATPRNAAYVAYATVVGTAFFALAYYFLYKASFSRLLLLEALVFSFLLTMLWHIVYEKILRLTLWSDPPTFPTLIVGVTRESKELIHQLNRHKNPLRPVAVLDGMGTKENDIDGVPVLGKLNKLEETLTSKKITHLIQCSDLEQSLNLLSACRNRGITYGILPSVMGIVERDERIESLEGKGVTMVSPKQNPWMWFFR